MWGFSLCSDVLLVSELLRSEIYGSQKKFAPENKKIVFDFAVSKSFNSEIPCKCRLFYR